MRTIGVEDNRIVVSVNGRKVCYNLAVVQNRISAISAELETWREYERLLLNEPVKDTDVHLPPAIQKLISGRK